MLCDTDLQQQINDAKNSGKTLLTVTGEYEISNAVLLPSDFTLVLSECTLRLADGVYTQIFRNAGYREGERNTEEDADSGIRILGRGKAVLDGGNYNGLSEQNAGKEGLPPIWRNNLLLFANVRNFEISGLSVRNQRWWALCFLYCRDGRIGELDFCANDTYTDENGVLRHGLVRSHYAGVTVKNADGIDLRVGCRRITVENISGFCEDDTIALTALDGRTERAFAVEGAARDMEDITVRHIHAHSFCSVVRLLNQAPGVQMRRILIEDVADTSSGSPHMDRGLYAVRIGDSRLYGPAPLSADAVQDITVRSVRARTVYAVGLAGRMRDIRIEDVEVFDGSLGVLEDARPKEGA